jgi:coenzyme F420 hydrogenase subunit beta
VRYAITCLPEQSASLRVLQHLGYGPAKQIKYVLGPYTGTGLEPVAIRCLLRSHGIRNDDEITSLKWRAGEWPGYLEVKLASGKIIKSKKVYYNFLIPFFVTQSSLQSIDFSNEFTDLSVGDAWSPKFESVGAGFSVVITRSDLMESIVREMINKKYLTLEDINQDVASEMHGHMLDFKKRGGFIRNKWRQSLGLKSPDYGIVPIQIPLSRYLVEVVISGLFVFCRNSFSRKILELIPESIIGPLFNRLRLTWKSASKPSKRKGLSDLDFVENDNGRSF